MLTNHGRCLMKANKSLLNKIVKRNITKSDVINQNIELDSKLKYDPIKEPEKFKKEYEHTHWLSKFTEKVTLWYRAPFRLRIWSTDKDTELGRFSWNSNGALNNTLSKILQRNERYQTKKMMAFFIKNFEHRNTLEINRAEEPPKISPNSVFIYKDPSNTLVNRRSTERFALFLVLTMAWNVPTLLMYTFIAWYFQILSKNIFVSRSMAVRMDLIPETEQLHIMKIGFLGLPYSVLVNIKDLVKIEKEEDNSYPLRWYKSRLWIPIEDENLVFKNTSTGEIISFSKRGVWNEDGLNHKLLN